MAHLTGDKRGEEQREMMIEEEGEGKDEKGERRQGEKEGSGSDNKGRGTKGGREEGEEGRDKVCTLGNGPSSIPPAGPHLLILSPPAKNAFRF